MYIYIYIHKYVQYSANKQVDHWIGLGGESTGHLGSQGNHWI